MLILVVTVVLHWALYDGSMDAVCNTSGNPLSSTMFIGLLFIAIHLARTFISLSVADLPIRGVFSSLVWRRALLWLAKLLTSLLLMLAVTALASGCFALSYFCDKQTPSHKEGISLCLHQWCHRGIFEMWIFQSLDRQLFTSPLRYSPLLTLPSQLQWKPISLC